MERHGKRQYKGSGGRQLSGRDEKPTNDRLGIGARLIQKQRQSGGTNPTLLSSNSIRIPSGHVSSPMPSPPRARDEGSPKLAEDKEHEENNNSQGDAEQKVPMESMDLVAKSLGLQRQSLQQTTSARLSGGSRMMHADEDEADDYRSKGSFSSQGLARERVRRSRSEAEIRNAPREEDDGRMRSRMLSRAACSFQGEGLGSS